MYIQMNPGLGQVATTFDVNKAIRNNRIYGQQLGWQKYYGDIAKFLGFTVKPSESEFAQEVAQWQQSQGMKADGMIGTLTWKAILAVIPVGPKVVRRVQFALNRLLGTHLVLDGVLGQETRNAVRSFQQRERLSVTGDLDLGTQRRLEQTFYVPLPAMFPCESEEVINHFVKREAFVVSDDTKRYDQFIKRISQCINDSQRTSAPIEYIEVTGHASKEGPADQNYQLGWKRARRVAEDLKANIKAKRVEIIYPPDHSAKPLPSGVIVIVTDSKGADKLIAKGDTEIAHRKNRRVVVTLPIIKEAKPRDCPPNPSGVFTQVIIDLVRQVIRDALHRVLRDAADEAPPGLRGFIKSLRNKLLRIKPPTAVRFLCKSETNEAFKVFGGSLDLTKILISDGLGLFGRPFTVAVNHPDGWHVVMNLGHLDSWIANRRRKCILIHELTHAWQSQHHSTNKQAFMWNAIRNQVGAAISAPDFNFRAAYAYIPKRPFGENSAEQIAQRVQDDYRGTEKSPDILRVIRPVKPYVHSAENENSLNKVSILAKAHPGVRWPTPCN